MGKKHIILFIFILVLLIILLKNNEYFNILGGDVYAIKNYDSCDGNYEAVSLMTEDSKLCIKKREKGNNGIRNIEKDTNGNVFSSIVDKSGYKFYIPSKSKYIGCIKKNKHDKDFNNAPTTSDNLNFQNCSSSSGDFFGMSIPEFNNQENYAKNIFTDKKLNCYNFNNKIPNLKESIVDDYNCDKIRTDDNKFLGGLGYIALYQKENKYQGLNFNFGIIKRDNLFTFDDIEEVRNNMFFWYKNHDDKYNPIIRSGIGDSNGNFTKIQKGFNNQKTYILRDYSGNSNIAELKHIKGLGTYIIKIKLNQFNSRTDSDNQIIVSEIKSYFTTRSLDCITNNNLECEEEKKNKKKKKNIRI